jgi:hypothetical protein
MFSPANEFIVDDFDDDDEQLDDASSSEATVTCVNCKTSRSAMGSFVTS